jgi:hypothetical protein
MFEDAKASGKYTDKLPKSSDEMDRICLNCGEDYGHHCGENCPPC